MKPEFPLPMLLLSLLLLHFPRSESHDYGEALSKCILFFEGQRSGRIPPNQRMTWRRDSGLSDGWSAGADLVGGYYDAGDNVKFGFPMAFTTTMLAWSVIEFGDSMPSGELGNALTAIRWATDYLLKTVAQSDRIFVQVGEPIHDHNCWERPEDMDTPRTVYAVDRDNPGSEIAGETAAALSAASMALRPSDPTYASLLLQNAIRVFDFADKYRGAYSDSEGVRAGVCPFYCNFNGYKDELLWGAAWLRRASQDDSYLEYITTNQDTLGAEETTTEFGWDNKHAGINVLISREFLEGQRSSLESYKERADSFMCTLVPGTAAGQITYTGGGLIYKPGGSNMQHVTSIAFLLLVYANYLSLSSRTIDCGTITVGPNALRQQAKKQVDYILGENPMNMSYMVGYGNKYPQRIHHRGSSLPSTSLHPQPIACKEGTIYYNSSEPNLNTLVGAVVGGPGEDDIYEDDRSDAVKSEPTTYINAPLVGALAHFVANPYLA